MIPVRDNVPARRYPLITVTLILANVVAFLYELSLQPEVRNEFIFLYGMVPAKLVSQHPVDLFGNTGLSIFSSMFLHGGWVHLLGNMWYLWIFGDNVEDRMGHFRFLLFYLLCGALAAVAHIIFNLGSEIPSIGASGAVAGVLGAYLLSYPFARILTFLPLFFFWPIVELPALLVLGFWFFVQIMNGTAAVAVTAETVGGVAWWAHIGGFLAGMFLIGVFARRSARKYHWRE